MFTLAQVINGLKEGQAYERAFKGDGGKEYLSPSGEGEFCHAVAGLAFGGCGGSNVMPISILNNGRWPEDGWKRSN